MIATLHALQANRDRELLNTVTGSYIFVPGASSFRRAERVVEKGVTPGAVARCHDRRGGLERADGTRR